MQVNHVTEPPATQAMQTEGELDDGGEDDVHTTFRPRQQ
jgi:hypothetical protein